MVMPTDRIQQMLARGQNPTDVGVGPQVQPGSGGIFSKIDQTLMRPGGSFLLNLLAQEGRTIMAPGQTIPGPLGAIGRAGLMTQQQQQQQEAFDLQQELMKNRLGMQNRRAEIDEQRLGLDRERLDIARERLSQDPDDPSAVREFEAFERLADGTSPDRTVNPRTGYSPAQERFLEVKRSQQLISEPGIGVQRLGSGGRTSTVVSEDVIREGAADRTRATEEAKGDPGRERALPNEVLALEQTLQDVDRTISALESGNLTTGPLQQFTDMLSEEGQTLNSLGGKQVIDLISSATFGSLSEGEMRFLQQIAFGLDRDEEFNKRQLTKFRNLIKRRLDNYRRDAERLGVDTTSDVDDADAIASKYVD